MQITQDQLEKLKAAYPGAKLATEAGLTYILLPNVSVEAAEGTKTLDLLFCPEGRDGYTSRLFFPERVVTKKKDRNWNGNVRILERNWVAISWKTEGASSLVELVADHLRALTCTDR